VSPAPGPQAGGGQRAAPIPLARSKETPMTSNEIAVRVRGVAKSFGGTRILNDIAVDIGKGEVHAFVGENGAGKSSLGKIIGGYYTPDTGTVEVWGEPVTRFSPRDALAHGVAMI